MGHHLDYYRVRRTAALVLALTAGALATVQAIVTSLPLPF